ncbi:MAG: nitroreductase family protein [Actinobacteria bacterium]|nr:nitroreductase family protein [Actinomycetota bacterium]MCG2818990.1 nitroreductase family protein [Actinomycetes bacterium]MBU4179233.1 nitroreductase family protein [Actinomycetota bacterium]MBU4217830.1 nitroreductase family protein [Actinomycetota bacterium]MBU4359332.1 nitroreductase family protein [Actinomycetota bacterium]
METMEAIRTRRSVREYTGEAVTDDELDRLLQAARWAPSGLNNQPWRFMKVTNRVLIDGLSELTKYRGVVSGAEVLIAVFLDGREIYDRTKDLQSSGAALQNILLAAHNMGLGACWLGEILNRRQEAEELLKVSGDLEMVAVVALGRPVARERAGVRHPVEDMLVYQPER